MRENAVARSTGLVGRCHALVIVAVDFHLIRPPATGRNGDIADVGRKSGKENPTPFERFFKEKVTGVIHRLDNHKSSRLQERVAKRPSALASTHGRRRGLTFLAIRSPIRGPNQFHTVMATKTSPDTSVVHSISTRGRQP